MPQGAPLQRGSSQWSWSHLCPPNWKISQASGYVIQVSAPNNAEMEDVSLEEVHTPSSPTAEALGPSGDAPPPNVACLWEDANKALADLLAIKSSTDAHWWKLILEFGMALCQNDSEAMESIKEVKAICTHSIQEAEDHCSVAIREAEA